MQTKAGGITYRNTMIKKYGSEEAWKKSCAERGSTGGKAKVPKGFALMDPKKRSEAGRKGGTNSSRSKDE